LPKDFDPENPKPHFMWFVLSSEDEKQNPPRLSVFASRLTTPAQAWKMAVRSKQLKHDLRAVAVIRVRTVRALRPNPEMNSAPNLDVIWDRNVDRGEPGNRGHAGITGLDSIARKSYRQQLAATASLSFL
jgi:hypothetical protein